MSHISTYKHVVSNVKLFCDLAREKGYNVITGEGLDVKLFGSQVVKDCKAAINVKGWKYAVAINQRGEILYDHFGSESGSMENLHGLMQNYNQAAIIQQMPMDIVDSYHVTEDKDGNRELILEYGT